MSYLPLVKFVLVLKIKFHIFLLMGQPVYQLIDKIQTNVMLIVFEWTAQKMKIDKRIGDEWEVYRIWRINSSCFGKLRSRRRCCWPTFEQVNTVQEVYIRFSKWRNSVLPVTEMFTNKGRVPIYILVGKMEQF